MGGFGRVAGTLANDVAAAQKDRTQQIQDIATQTAQRAELAQRVRSQMIQDQLEQGRLSLEQSRNELESRRFAAETDYQQKTLALQRANYEMSGWEKKGDPLKDKQGNWHEMWFNPRTNESRTIDYPPGYDPLAFAKSQLDYQNKLYMENAREQNREHLANLQEDLRERLKRIAPPDRPSTMDAEKWRRIRGDGGYRMAESKMNMDQAEIKRIDAQLDADKDPAARTGIIGGVLSRRLTDPEIDSLVNRKNFLMQDMSQQVAQMEIVVNRELYGVETPTNPPNPQTPAPGAGAPPPPKGFTPIAGPNG